MRKQAETRLPLKKKTAENLKLLADQSAKAQQSANEAQANLLNAVTMVLNERDIDEAELVKITAPTKTDPVSYLVVIVKKRAKA